jgi:hypothetical protein
VTQKIQILPHFKPSLHLGCRLTHHADRHKS